MRNTPMRLSPMDGGAIENGFLYDSSALAYFTAAVITDETQKDAWNNFVVGAKADGFYNKLLCVYPIIGGTASQHSYNAIDPTKYQVTWINVPTQDANGVTYNGTTQYGKTGLVPSTEMVEDDSSIFIGVGTNVAEGRLDISARGAASTLQMEILCRHALGGQIIAWQYSDATNNTSSTLDSIGLYVSSRRSNTSHELYKDGVSLLENVGADASSPPAFDIWLGCRNTSGVASNYSTKRHNIYGMSSGLTDTDVTNLNARYVTLQTELGR